MDSLIRGSLQVAASVVVAALSWRFIEEPIRHGAIGRWLAQLRAGAWRAAPRRAWAVVAAVSGVLVMTVAALTGVVPAASAGQDAGSMTAPIAGPAAPIAGPTAQTASARQAPAVG